jgi:hypothetical protein
VVTFRNIKPRGNNALSATYAYTLDRSLSYADILLSVREVEADRVPKPRAGVEATSQASIIEVIKSCITEGICTKTKLAHELMARTRISRVRAFEMIDRHNGDDPLKHLWCWTNGPRGAQVYRLHEGSTASPPASDG